MHRADTRAGQHRHGRLRDHRHIQRDHVTALDAQRFQAIGEATDLFVQLPVSDRQRLGRVIAFPDDRGLLAACFEMTVQAIGGHVELPVLIPADVQIVRGIGHVPDLGVGLDPVDTLALLRPEAILVLDRTAVHAFVGLAVHPGVRRPVCRDGIAGIFGHDLGFSLF